MCHAATGSDYWPPIYEREAAAVDQKRVEEKAAAERKKAAEKTAAAQQRAAAETAAAEWKRTAPERARLARKQGIGGMIGAVAGGLAGAALGGIVGFLAAFVAAFVAIIPLVLAGELFGFKDKVNSFLTVMFVIAVLVGGLYGLISGGAATRTMMRTWLGRRR